MSIKTLIDARQYVKDNREDGCTCPCCGQKAKVWKKTIISTSAADLIRLVNMYQGTALHYDQFATVKKDRNFSQLVLRGLIKAEDNDDSSKRSSGMWHPTERGIRFARGEIRIQKYVLTYNNKKIGVEGAYVRIEDVLGKKFNYEELIDDNY